MKDGMVGVKLTGCDFSAALAKIVRKYREIPVSEIKALVLKQDYLLTSEYIDVEGVKRVLSLHRDLDLAGIENALYEHDTLAAEELLCNWVQTMADIAEEVELDMEREAEAD